MLFDELIRLMLYNFLVRICCQNLKTLDKRKGVSKNMEFQIVFDKLSYGVIFEQIMEEESFLLKKRNEMEVKIKKLINRKIAK